jgi:hypothetical protein
MVFEALREFNEFQWLKIPGWHRPVGTHPGAARCAARISDHLHSTAYCTTLAISQDASAFENYCRRWTSTPFHAIINLCSKMLP